MDDPRHSFLPCAYLDDNGGWLPWWDIFLFVFFLCGRVLGHVHQKRENILMGAG